MEPLPELHHHDGLTMRRWTEADAELVEEVVTANLDHLRPYMPWVAFEPMAIEDRRALERQWEQAWAAGGDVIYGIFDDAADTCVGGSGLHRRIGAHGLEIGYWVHVDHLGRGIARRTSAGLTDLAFTVDGIERVEIRHDLSNVHSRRVPEALGFRLIGRDVPNRELTAPAEVGVDLVWRVTRDEWLAR